MYDRVENNNVYNNSIFSKPGDLEPQVWMPGRYGAAGNGCAPRLERRVPTSSMKWVDLCFPVQVDP